MICVVHTVLSLQTRAVLIQVEYMSLGVAGLEGGSLVSLAQPQHSMHHTTAGYNFCSVEPRTTAPPFPTACNCDSYRRSVPWANCHSFRRGMDCHSFRRHCKIRTNGHQRLKLATGHGFSGTEQFFGQKK